MLRFISISLRNFLSFGNATTVVNLDRTGTTLIVGEDLDNTANGRGANGCGKTALINGLAYAIFDKPVSNISKDNLVNNINKKNMEVSVVFEKDNVFYKVLRVRKSKSYAAGNYVKLFMKHGSDNFVDADEITPDSVTNTNKLITKIIGIPHELFVRIVVFSATHIPFLDLPGRHPTSPCQTNIIEELFELTELADDAENLKVILKENELLMKDAKTTIGHLEREHMRHATQMRSAKERIVNWQKSNQQDVVDLDAKLSKIIDVDIEGERELHTELTAVEDDIADINQQLTDIANVIGTLSRKEKKKNKELKHLVEDECPFCLQKFSHADNKIAEIEKDLEDIVTGIAEMNDEVLDFDSQVGTLTIRKVKIKGEIRVPNFEELLDIKNESENINNRIAELKDITNPFVEPFEELENTDLDDIDYHYVNDLAKTIDHQKFLLKLLTRKDSFVRKALLNKNIPFLNLRLKTYLNDLGLPHTVEFSHDLTANISQFGRPLDFGNLSNGQRARVNLALSFAFRDVLQKLHVQINICMLDEVLDVGLDTVGVQLAARMLKRKSREEQVGMFIISHKDEVEGIFDKVLTVQMEKGFSYIKEDGDA